MSEASAEEKGKHWRQGRHIEAACGQALIVEEACGQALSGL